MMKKKGSKFYYDREREADLLRVYHEKLRAADIVRLSSLLDDVVNSPSQRFWVSSERASVVVSHMLRGGSTRRMNPLRREMYEEICRRVKQLRAVGHRGALSHLVREVVSSPAPKFYLTAAAARKIIYRHKRRWWRQHNRDNRLM